MGDLETESATSGEMRAVLRVGFLILSLGCVLVPGSFAFPATFTLERSFPLNQRPELSQLRARDRVRHGRLLQSSSSSSSSPIGVVDLPVDGSADPFTVGLYFTRIQLGSPPKEYYVQIDTGSDILWVSCTTCSGCPKSSGLGIQLQFYDPGSSSSASVISCSHEACTTAIQTAEAGCSQDSQCAYAFQYGDGSGTAGYFVSDMLYFNSILGEANMANASAPIIFGCSNYQSGDLTKPDRAVDGIIGFGQNQLSVISQMSSRGLAPRVFSHCLRGTDSGGGILVLGEIVEPGIVYSSLVPSQPHYNLNLQSIAVNGQALPVDPSVFATSRTRGTIVDSGTTLAYLPDEAYVPFLEALMTSSSQSVQSITSKGNQCFLFSGSVNNIFPPVAFNFDGGASIGLRPEEYLIQEGFVDGAALWCMGFLKSETSAITILGDLVLKDKIFVYDLARQRLGWANYDCSQSVNVSLTSGKDEVINAGQLSVSSSTEASFYKLIPIAIASSFVHISMFSWYLLL